MSSRCEISNDFKEQIQELFKDYHTAPQLPGGSGLRNLGTGHIINLKRKSDETKLLHKFSTEIEKAKEY